MPFLMFRKKYFSDKVGGGDLGVAIGIVQNTMITDGLIIVILHLGIEEYLMIGEIVTEIIGGVVVLGIIMAANLGVMAVGVNPVVTAADSGTIRVDGVDITALSETELAHWRANNVGFIFQFYNLIPVLKAVENVELPLHLTALSRRESNLDKR